MRAKRFATPGVEGLLATFLRGDDASSASTAVRSTIASVVEKDGDGWDEGKVVRSRSNSSWKDSTPVERSTNIPGQIGRAVRPSTSADASVRQARKA